MKTLKDYKGLLRNENNNTVLGMCLADLFNEKKDVDATIHHLEEKIEVMAQMDATGINVFTDSYKLGSVSKAFYMWKLSQFSEF